MQNFNILIIGAGIAGLTFANLLKREGVNFRIIEKETSDTFNNSGYMLGLLPLGGRVLTELDLEKEYFDQSIEMTDYEIHKENGKLNKAYSLNFINKNYGSYRGIERKKLVEILIDGIEKAQILFGITANEIRQIDNLANVTFSDGKKESFDLVIVADGIHSETRKLLWNEKEYSYRDTNWGGWVGWLENQEMATYKEYWGASSFMGLYPVKNKVGVFLGGPNESVKKQGLYNFAKKIQNEILPEFDLIHKALDVLASTENPFYWEFHDCRTNDWNKGNVILLGDAACGFLPTAGVGASMAMDSASALVDELSRTDKEHLEYGIKMYLKRQKKRVETAQEDSRKLGDLMFVKSNLIAGIRDYAVRFYSIKQLAKNISKTMEG
ncbi:FAD-dependent monooxygenase [Flavobacteriaceae bacterium F89]|uniref:FAD-dependent monooxygenase n=1 Tax=Cerina litoralis TaxID=2874477 RepID=A0AAE3EQF0_9FLAO|nr:NAD(P)/FAD-dependent oxidoreductase [Cerina litoralis]MCG2459170.1 FAD-dependent monooxygenase [Cerina litoralis]